MAHECPPEAVAPEAAFAAAEERVVRTTRALLGAEARVVDLRWRLERAIADNARLLARVAELEEVTTGGESSQGADADGAVDPTHAFSD